VIFGLARSLRSLRSAELKGASGGRQSRLALRRLFFQPAADGASLRSAFTAAGIADEYCEYIK